MPLPKPFRTLEEVKIEISASPYSDISPLILSWVRVGYGDWQLKLACSIDECTRIRQVGFDEILRGLVSVRCNPCDTKHRHHLYRLSRGSEITRICTHCGDEKTRDLFSIRDQNVCDGCSTWQNRYNHLRRKYDLSIINFWVLYNEQLGLCPICLKHLNIFTGRFPVVDHCHDTNIVRGLLHISCNASLHIFERNEENFIHVEQYLKRKKAEVLVPPPCYNALLANS